MDPLSVAASIIGILAAAGKVVDVLGPVVSATKDIPKLAPLIYSEVVNTRILLAALQKLLLTIEARPRHRSALIGISQIVVVLTDGVLVFSELEALTPALGTPVSQISLRTRIQWARREAVLSAIHTRLQCFKSSISLMLNIFQCDSDITATNIQREFSAQVSTLLQNVSCRLASLESSFENGSIISPREAPALVTEQSLEDAISIRSAISITKVNENMTRNAKLSSQVAGEPTPGSDVLILPHEFENELESSRVYRRARRQSCDFSFRSSIAYTHHWSMISDLSLSNISNIAVIALPLCSGDITNAHHYFGTQPTVADLIIKPSQLTRSLYHDCLIMREKLVQISGIEEFFRIQQSKAEYQSPADQLWAVLRQGTPLLLLYNALNPEVKLKSPDIPDRSHKAAQILIFRVFRACTQNLGFNPQDCVLNTDLAGESQYSWAGLKKVMKLAERLLQMLSSSGVVHPIDELSILTPSWKRETHTLEQLEVIAEEFILDERLYTIRLQQLLDLKERFRDQQLMTNDRIHQIFPSVVGLIDAQQHFLVKAEMIFRYAPLQQNWGQIFLDIAPALSIYRDHILHEGTFKDAALRELQKSAKGSQESEWLADTIQLLSFPSQRLSKYFVFLQELEKEHGNNPLKLYDIAAALEIVQGSQRLVAGAMRQKELVKVEKDFVRRVSDWKNHNVEDFGDLILYDVVNIHGKSPIKPLARKQYHAYLFRNILIFAQPYRNNGAKSNWWTATDQLPLRSEVPRLKIRGRVFLRNVTNISSSSKLGLPSCEVAYTTMGAASSHSSEALRFVLPTNSRQEEWIETIKQLTANNLHSDQIVNKILELANGSDWIL